MLLIETGTMYFPSSFVAFSIVTVNLSSFTAATVTVIAKSEMANNKGSTRFHTFFNNTHSFK